MKKVFVSIIFAAAISSCQSEGKFTGSGESKAPVESIGEENRELESIKAGGRLYKDKAASLWNSKKFDQAITELEKRQKQDPQNYTDTLVGYYCRQDQFQKALSVCDQHISELERMVEPVDGESKNDRNRQDNPLPKLVDVYILKGRILCISKDYQNADVVYDTALECCRKYKKQANFLNQLTIAELLKDKVYCLFQLKEYKKAITYLEKAMRFEPSGNSLTIKLCRLYKLAGLTEKHNYWKQVIIASEIHNGVLPPSKRASILKEIGDYDEALDVLESVKPKPLYSMAIVYELKDKPARALQFYTKAFESSKDKKRKFEILVRRAKIHLELKDYKNAFADSDKACKLNVGSVEAYRLRYRALKNLGKTEEAKEDFLQALSLDTSSVQSRFLRLRDQLM